MLPQNTAPWHTEYFKPNALVVQHVQRGLSDLPLKQVIRPSRERCSPSTQRKAFFSPRLRTPRPHLPHTPFQPITFCDTLYSSSNLAKHSGLTHSSGLHFLMKAPVSHQTVCFSLANLPFVTGPQLTIQTGRGKRYFSTSTVTICLFTSFPTIPKHLFDVLISVNLMIQNSIVLLF